ncbi:beta-N-acetylhexosaminidase [Bacteriovorax sp. DB6_IX]|uniref:beta-N-acetylhexosaminidase n=1 Tax=Bacteriovorax sp. DB6_IX TaxID=1353530 RepID=UPI000389FA71|nr:beta-N-acetylhexosaminidase [Bacteriovorax sp. DB6_IX]EQC51259.1 glycoside hydrolase, family 3, N-terminal domain protein [Bacteriovorax sp. DB6_IX]
MKELGQLFITGISGTVLTEDEKKFIRDENIGGVILFKNNYESPAQLAELVNSIQELRDHYPLFIAVDHEGGRVIRFREHFTQFPAMLDLAKTDSPKQSFAAHSVMGKELRACGININLSPVCDVFTNPNNKVIGDRSFGHDKETVSLFVSSAIRGLQTEDIMACAKHFPGHGCTTKDSHYDLPIVKKSLEELREEEFEPFVKAVKSRVEFVMMAHMQVDSIDEELPCTLSKNAYDLLRSETKFKKVIITDDMDMKAITDNYSYGEAAVMALNAGADVLEYRSMDSCKEAYFAAQESYKKKEIEKADIDKKLERIYDLKKKYLKDYKPLYIPDIEKSVGTQENLNVAEEINKIIASKSENSNT